MVHIHIGKDGLIVRDIHFEVEHMAERFVTEEIGLVFESSLKDIFIKHWMDSAFPEFMEEDHDFSEEPETEPKKEMWAICDMNKNGEVICTAYWYPERIEIKALTEWFERIASKAKDPKLIALARQPEIKAKGGRPKLQKQEKLYPESIVCAILKDKQGLVYKEIGKVFGWSIAKDSYGNPNACNTAKSRIDKGRQILSYYQQ